MRADINIEEAIIAPQDLPGRNRRRGWEGRRTRRRGRGKGGEALHSWQKNDLTRHALLRPNHD